MTYDQFGDGLNFEQVRLSAEVLQDTISTMKHGQVGYIDAFCLWVDADGDVWLDESAPVFDPDDETDMERLELEEPCDTIRVICIEADGEKGYIVDRTVIVEHFDDDERWYIQGNDSTDSVPVIALVEDPFTLENMTNLLNEKYGIEVGECVIRAMLESQEEQED